MPYAVPSVWAHGDIPTHTNINKFKDGLDAIYALTGSVEINPAVARRIDPVQGYYFLHRHRWLVYRADPSAGRIEDPLGTGETVSLAVTGSSWGTYDLSQVDWLYPGRLYQVQAVVACLEDVEAL